MRAAIARGVRPGCPADTHDSWDSYQRKGCCCPGAVEKIRAAGRKRARRLAGIGTGRWPQRYTDTDRVVVERECSGTLRGPISVIERTEAVTRLTEAGMSVAEIARVLRVAPRTVARYRGRAKAGAAA
jgi:DNA-binding NarL/FixJ family response regulator